MGYLLSERSHVRNFLKHYFEWNKFQQLQNCKSNFLAGIEKALPD